MGPSLLFAMILTAPMPLAARCEPPPQWQATADRPARDNGCPLNPQILPPTAHQEVTP